MKKYIVYLILVLVLLSPFFSINNNSIIYAESEKTIDEQLSDNIESQLNNLDFNAMERILYQLNDQKYNFFGSSSFTDKLKSLISGEFALDGKNIFRAIVDLIFDNILDFLPILTLIIAISILSSFISALRSNNSGKSVADIIHFICYGLIIVIVINSTIQIITLTSSTLMSMKMQMEAIFPILLTVMTAIGGRVSVGVFQPAVALLCGTVMQLFNSIVMPIFIFMLIFSIISNLTSTIKLDKFTAFFSSLFKYIIGFTFTIFTAFLAIQGITAGSVDSVSIRTAKFAIKSYIPILGGYLSEGFNVILTSSVLIKNAIGASGLILLFATLIIPVVKIVVYMFMLKLAAAVLDPLSDNRTSNFIYGVSKSISMLLVMILGVALMYFITVGLVMCTANILG